MTVIAHDLRAYYDRKAVELDELRLTYESPVPYKRWFYGVRFGAVMQALAPVAGERLLEIGCGTGYYTRALTNLGVRVTATEYSPNYLAQAMRLVGEHPSVTFRVEDAQSLTLSDDAFDAVLMSEVIEHLPDREAALSEACRVTRPGGRLVLTTPSRFSPLNLAYALKRQVRRYPFNEHLHEYTIGELNAALGGRFASHQVTFANHLLPYPLDGLAARMGRHGIACIRSTDRAISSTPLIRRLGWTMVAVARKHAGPQQG